MADIRDEWRALVGAALDELRKTKVPASAEIDIASIQAETPPNPAMGDLGFPMFSFAKSFRMGPPVIAGEVVKLIAANPASAGLGGGAYRGWGSDRFRVSQQIFFSFQRPYIVVF